MKDVNCLVIGSGPSGAITAWELIKNKKDVLMIDSGSNLSLDSCKPYSTLEMEQKYKYGGLNPTYNNPKVSFVEGECVGGGSEVNSGFYHRTPDYIIDDWAKTNKIIDFSSSKLKEHFKIIEKDISVSYLPDSIQAAKASLKLREGADKLGWKSMEVPRWYKFNKDGTGTKQSMTETYIKWYTERGGRLIDNLKATRIKFLNGKWEVNCINKKSNHSMVIKTEYLFLCGGAISSPFLLKSSGIKKNIGNSLQMHPTVKVIAKFDEVVNYTDMGVPVHQVKEFSPLISFGCSISSKHHLALAMLDNKKYLHIVDKEWEKMAIYYAMIKPEGKGKIIKIPFLNDPLVKFKFNDNDLINLSNGLKKLCEILFKAGATNIYPSINSFGSINYLNDIQKIPDKLSKNKTSLMTIHLFSSCPMGENKNICAVDSYGKLIGYEKVYINDGSILPTAPGVNPQGTIMAIARRNIHKFLQINK